jgi:uroporphyrinogen decarboxylase
MTSRERVVKALNHEEPDRVPVDFGGLLASINLYTYEDLLDVVGIDDGIEDAIVSREWSNVPKPSEKLLERWGVDFRRVWLGGPDNFEPLVDEEEQTVVDEWGLTWKRIGKYNEFVNPPLEGATVQDVLNYTFPDPEDPGRYRGVEEWAKKLHDETDYAVVAGHSMFGVFELGCWLCGFNDFLPRLFTDKKFVHTFFGRVLEIQKAVVGRYIDLVGPYVQMIETADDLGQQFNSLMSVETYREMIKPYHTEYLQFIKEKAPHAKIFMHSCGSVHNLIPDLIDNGVEVLNPLQPTARNMEPERLKADFGDKLSFHGGIDVVEVLPNSKPREVKETVENVMRTLGRGGGYILAASHNVQDDTPPANVAAMYEAGLEYGRYPLDGTGTGGSGGT